MMACKGKPQNQDENQNGGTSQSTAPNVELPTAAPSVPANQGQPTVNVINADGTKTPIKIENGKPLDFSQLAGGQQKSFGDEMASNIDSIKLMAEKGDAGYQYLYASCYDQGWGVQKDPVKALQWYKKSADQKYKASYNALGNMYRVGDGVKADPKAAFDWFKKGAEANEPQSILNIGNCYYFGTGTTKDDKKAVEYWQKAADLGYSLALSQMGDSYFYGIGMEKNYSKAIEYWTKAADKNVPSAQFHLGLAYYEGKGVKQDKAHAKLLMSKARDGGMTEAQKFLDEQF